MHVAILADAQLGNHKRFGGDVVGSINMRCRMILDVLNAAADRIIEERCDYLVVAGDLFDYVRPEAPLIAEVQRTFERITKGLSGAGIILLRGNHDMASTAPGDNALAPLAPYATIVDNPELLTLGRGYELLAVPFQPGPVKEWLAPTLRALLEPPVHAGAPVPRQDPNPPPARLLALHMGIKDEKTPPWLADSTAAIDLDYLTALAQLHGVTAVAAGDWHARQVWRMHTGDAPAVHVMQVGALVPTGWDNPGLTGYGTLAFWRPGEVKPLVHEELAGPRFVKVKTSLERDALLKAARKMVFGSVFVSHETVPDQVQAEHAFWNAAADVQLGGIEILPDASIAKEEGRQAGALAASAETVQEALAAYVKSMPLPDGVRRGAVLTRAKAYLK